MIWKDKWDMHILTNTHRQPVGGTFCDKQGKSQKPVIVKDYKIGMWAMLTKEVEWLIAIQSIGEHGSWWKNYPFTSWTQLHWIATSFCHPVAAEQTTENSVWLWFKICWKWVPWSFILIPPQEEDQTHKPDIMSTNQLQYHAYGVMCGVNIKQTTIKFSVCQLQSWPVSSPMYHNLPWKGKFPNQISIIMWEGNHFKKCKCSTFDYNNTMAMKFPDLFYCTF